MKYLVLVLLLASCASKPKMQNGIDREAIRSALKSHEKEVLECYEKRLKVAPNTKGKLVISWDVEKGGVAKSVHVNNETSTVKDAGQPSSVSDCVVKVVEAIKFPEPPPNQTVDVSYPWFLNVN